MKVNKTKKQNIENFQSNSLPIWVKMIIGLILFLIICYVSFLIVDKLSKYSPKYRAVVI
jgi:hypothetical protein